MLVLTFQLNIALHNVTSTLLENHFGGLLESDATSKIVDKKIDAILARPEGVCVCDIQSYIPRPEGVCVCVCVCVCV